MIPVVGLHFRHGMMDQMVNAIPRVPMVLAVLQKGGVENLTDIANVKAASIFEQKLLR